MRMLEILGTISSIERRCTFSISSQADGEKVFQNVELDPEEYDWMGGRNIFSKHLGR